MENDLSLLTRVVAVIEYKDKETPNNTHSANKFRLVEYVQLFPEVVHHMLEKKINGREGQINYSIADCPPSKRLF